MKTNMNQWQKFVAEVREWDRREHNWQELQRKSGTMPIKNLTTKNDFIHQMMKKYKLQKRAQNHDYYNNNLPANLSNWTIR